MADISKIMGIELASTQVVEGDRGIFGGGQSGDVTYINTIQRISISVLGNATDFGDLTQARRSPGACSNGNIGRGVFGGGEIITGPTRVNTIDYITISTPGDALDFGDLVGTTWAKGTSNGSTGRGLFCYSYPASNVLEYIEIPTPGNSSDFGDLTLSLQYKSAISNGTNDRGVFAGGYAGYSYSNVIAYVTISSAGNAVDFGDLTVARLGLAGCSSLTGERGVFAGGQVPAATNVMDYITINSTGNAADFGDLLSAITGMNACSKTSRGIFAGASLGGGAYSDVMQYITFTSPGNSLDFGDLVVGAANFAGTANAG